MDNSFFTFGGNTMKKAVAVLLFLFGLITASICYFITAVGASDYGNWTLIPSAFSGLADFWTSTFFSERFIFLLLLIPFITLIFTIICLFNRDAPRTLRGGIVMITVLLGALEFSVFRWAALSQNAIRVLAVLNLIFGFVYLLVLLLYMVRTLRLNESV